MIEKSYEAKHENVIDEIELPSESDIFNAFTDSDCGCGTDSTICH